MSTKLSARTKASRANGALGRGRKTDAGLHRSSLNALKHGLLAGTVVLSTESQETFDLHLDKLFQRLRPADQVEAGIALEMASSTWRLRRLWQIETSLMDDAIANTSTVPETENSIRTARAFSKLAAGPDLDLIDRYESRLHRIYHRSLLNLALLRDIDRITQDRSLREDDLLGDLEAEEIAPELVAQNAKNPKPPNEPRSSHPIQNSALTTEHSAPENILNFPQRGATITNPTPITEKEDQPEPAQPKNDA
jgi:hypothetical protein